MDVMWERNTSDGSLIPHGSDRGKEVCRFGWEIALGREVLKTVQVASRDGAAHPTRVSISTTLLGFNVRNF